MSNNPTRLEVNFCRLLGQCNKFISDGQLDNWRLETYTQSLEEMLCELKQGPCRPKDEILNQHTQQVEFIKGLLHANSLPTASEKAMANQLMAPGPIRNTGSKSNMTQEIHLKTKGKYASEMRRELLDDGLRSRASNRGGSPDKDFDTMLRFHQNKQEQIAEEMVAFARNLKENSRLAGTIVRKDTESLEKSSKLADQNYDRLKVESVRLEQHTQRACNWWIWVMVLVVCVIFVMMILFMKLFRKSS